MARIELRERFLGGVVGEVDLAPTLSWSDHHALAQTADSTREVSDRLARVGMEIGQATRAVEALERSIGLGLERQVEVVKRQLRLLDEIAATLRTPAKTRAAEALYDAAELLRRRRWDRALSLAERAIDDDPNNPDGFVAAAWARMGRGELEQAAKDMIEAADASDGWERSANGRQAARMRLAVGGPEQARALLDRFAIQAREVGTAPALDALRRPRNDRLLWTEWESRSEEHGAVLYDSAIYAVLVDEDQEALEALGQSIDTADGYALMAMLDPMLSDRPALTELARVRLSASRQAWGDRRRELRASLRSSLDRLEASGYPEAGEWVEIGRGRLEWLEADESDGPSTRPVLPFLEALDAGVSRLLDEVQRRAALQEFALKWGRRRRAIIASDDPDRWFGVTGRRLFGYSIHVLRCEADGLPAAMPYHGSRDQLPDDLKRML